VAKALRRMADDGMVEIVPQWGRSGPDPKIGELVGARQRPAERQRSRAGLGVVVRPRVRG
jgi:hypothetical protein